MHRRASLEGVGECEAMNDEATITRQELYDLVWQKPMTRLAEEFGITDQRLASLCKQEAIPRPLRGHWNKLAFGKQVGARPPLPSGNRGVDAIVFRISDLLAPPATPKSQVDRHKAKIPPVRIPERLFHPHPVIAERIACRKADIRAGEEYYDCGTRAWEKITPFNDADRRLFCVLNAICQNLEAHGVAVSRNERGELTARSGCDAIVFQLRYRMKRIKTSRMPDSWDIRPKGDDVVRRDLEATGNLMFEMTSWMPSGFRRKWCEGSTYRMEQFASDIVATLILALPAIAAEREAREERRRLSEMRMRRQSELEAQRRLDKNRFRQLAEHAAAWRETSLLRRFVAAMREADLDMGMVIEGKTIARWLNWAEVAIDRHDPLLHPKGVIESIAAVDRWTYSD